MQNISLHICTNNHARTLVWLCLCTWRWFFSSRRRWGQRLREWGRWPRQWPRLSLFSSPWFLSGILWMGELCFVGDTDHDHDLDNGNVITLLNLNIFTECANPVIYPQQLRGVLFKCYHVSDSLIHKRSLVPDTFNYSRGLNSSTSYHL